MIEEELREFINRYIGSLLEWDLVLHIHSNGVTMKEKELGELFGYSEGEIKKALGKLKSGGLIQTDSMMSNVSILTPDLRDKVATFVDLLDNRRERMTILATVLQNEHTFF